MGRYFNESLVKFGAERVFEYGEGNAEGNHTEDDFNKWKKKLWRTICEHY